MKTRTLLLILFFISASALSYAKNPYLQKGEHASEVAWSMVWHDEFRSNKTIDSNWKAENAAPGHILSSRWRENINVKRGSVMLNNRKEQREGKEWTAGSMTCKQQFQYGYFECRMKISAAAATNNSFWFYQWNATDKLQAFEIDVVEGHYPNDMNSNIHNRGVKGTAKTKTVTNHCYDVEDLSADYHVYGLWWTEESLTFYLDGKAVWTTPNTCCFQPANMVLGSAVISWAGAVTDAIDGTAMSVDYVRVWKQI